MLYIEPIYKIQFNMTTITNAKLDWNDSGTPVSDQFDDVYFSNVDGFAESRYVFLHQNQLPERWHQFNQRRFVIAETGFGTGLNFLAAWQEFDQFRQKNPTASLQELHFISFEKFPLTKEDLRHAHSKWPELKEYADQLAKHYPIAVPECHRIVLADGAVTLDLWFGDIKDCMPMVPSTQSGLVDAWFLDGFAPSKNPEMWNQTLFNNMANLSKKDCSCATFTAAGFVRRGLMEAGFDMKKVKGFGTKREMLAGVMQEPKGYFNIATCFARQAVEGLEDVAIIGGGIASATLAKVLARRGIKTTLYCADDKPATGASGNKQGAVYPLINRDHSGVSRVFAPGMLFARQLFEQCADSIEFDHDWCGVTQLMWDDKSTIKLEKILQSGLPSELLTKHDRQQTNDTIGLPVDKESVHYSLGGWLCPSQLTANLIKELEQQGLLTTHFNTPITELNYDEQQQQWQLSSADQTSCHQTFSHQVVVIANGHQFDTFEQTKALPLGKVKGQVSHIPTSEALQQLKTVLCYDGYLTPPNPKNQSHCIGASYDKVNLDNHFDANAHADNAQKLKACLPEQDWPLEVDVSANQSRQGIRCVSRDHLPFVGQVGKVSQILTRYKNLRNKPAEEIPPLPQYSSLYCFVGLGSRGLSSAPLMAEVLASQLCGDPMPLPADLLNSIHPSKMWVRKLLKGRPISSQPSNEPKS